MIQTDGTGDTMIKLLYAISLLALICAGILLVSSGSLWLKAIPASESNSEVSIAEKFQTLGNLTTNRDQDVTSPLVEQATAYALYLNPPKPPEPKRSPAPRTNVPPAYVAPVTTPKFRLLATTYYRSSPEKSLALVSEPGKGDHWAKKGERLGHFIIERIEKGVIFYRDGNQLREMKVGVNTTAQSKQIQSRLSASNRTTKPDLRLLNAPPLSDVE